MNALFLLILGALALARAKYTLGTFD